MTQGKITTEKTPAQQAVIGRHPVFDTNLLTVGYWLPSRSVTGGPETSDPTTLLVSRLLAVGPNRVVGAKCVFMTADIRSLIQGALLLLPPGRSVVHIPDKVHTSHETVSAARTLVHTGVKISVTKQRIDDPDDAMSRLAEIVRIDVNAAGVDGVVSLADELMRRDVSVSAYQIKRKDHLSKILRSKVALLQGSALAQPSFRGGLILPISAMAAVRVAAIALDSSIDLASLERTISADPGMMLQLMSVASIGRLGQTRRNVRSIREALVFMGENRVRAWATLLVLKNLGTVDIDSILTALMRGRMCELRCSGHSDSAVAFIAGIVSALDILTGASYDKLRKTISINEEIMASAFDRKGPIGRIVDEVIDFEMGVGHTPALESIAAEALRWGIESIDSLT